MLTPTQGMQLGQGASPHPESTVFGNGRGCERSLSTVTGGSPCEGLQPAEGLPWSKPPTAASERHLRARLR